MLASQEGEAMTRVHIRWMVRRDMPEVLAIEHASFAHPWGEAEMLRVLRQRDCIGMVALHGERIVGFYIYELKPGHLRLLHFAVHPDFRRAGVGRQMVERLRARLSSHRRRLLALTVRESNLPGQLFWRSMGFVATAVERDWYEDTGEAAYVMEYRLAEMMEVTA